MTDIQQHYQEVAVVLASHAPDGWRKVWVDAEILDDWAKQTFDYVRSDGEEHWMEISDSAQRDIVLDNLRAVREQMSVQDEQKWKSVRFTVEPSGKFYTEFKYDD